MFKNPNTIKVAITDDHALLLNGLSVTIDSFAGFKVILHAGDGIDLLNKLKAADELPDILLLDVTMPRMDGIETAKEVTKTYPAIKIVALTVRPEEHIILQMIRSGCCAYLQKEIHVPTFEQALREIATKGKYQADIYNTNTAHLLAYEQKMKNVKISPNERQFLKYSARGLTHREIADEMFLSVHTIDDYRRNLFSQLDAKNRVDMILAAIRLDIIDIKKL